MIIVFRFYNNVKFLVFTSLRICDFRCSCHIFQQTEKMLAVRRRLGLRGQKKDLGTDAD